MNSYVTISQKYEINTSTFIAYNGSQMTPANTPEYNIYMLLHIWHLFCTH